MNWVKFFYLQITTLKDDIEGLRVQMLKEISSLKEDLDRERKAREALEKEVSVSYNYFTIL